MTVEHIYLLQHKGAAVGDGPRISDMVGYI
jgi:hypothetical protein